MLVRTRKLGKKCLFGSFWDDSRGSKEATWKRKEKRRRREKSLDKVRKGGCGKAFDFRNEPKEDGIAFLVLDVGFGP